MAKRNSLYSSLHIYSMGGSLSSKGNTIIRIVFNIAGMLLISLHGLVYLRKLFEKKAA